MDMSLEIPRLRVLFDWFCRVHLILDEVILRAHQRWWHITRHPECCWVVWAAHRNMPIRIEYVMVVENVAGCDQTTEEVFKADFFALREVSSRHGRDDDSKETWLDDLFLCTPVFLAVDGR
jgi:hypothetical protein